jgi:hypothetical protein
VNRLLLLSLVVMLNGCVIVQTHHVKLWVLCYRDETILPNGMYQNSELQMRCNKRSQLQFIYKPGDRPYTDILKDMHKSGD